MDLSLSMSKVPGVFRITNWIPTNHLETSTSDFEHMWHKSEFIYDRNSDLFADL